MKIIKSAETWAHLAHQWFSNDAKGSVIAATRGDHSVTADEVRRRHRQAVELFQLVFTGASNQAIWHHRFCWKSRKRLAPRALDKRSMKAKASGTYPHRKFRFGLCCGDSDRRRRVLPPLSRFLLGMR